VVLRVNEVGKGIVIAPESETETDDDSQDKADDSDSVESEKSDDESVASDASEERVDAVTTRTGRTANAPRRLVEEMTAIAAEFKCELTSAEEK
jgi:hypothetical protein